MSKFSIIEKLVTIKQAKELQKLKYYSFVVSVPNAGLMATVDDVIDWMRKKYNIVIYNAIEPFVDPFSHKILYRMSVKYCNVRDGWNGRIYIGESRLTNNIYAAKREAIAIAIRWIKKQQKNAKKRRKDIQTRSDNHNKQEVV